MSQSTPHPTPRPPAGPWLHRFAVASAVVTFVVIIFGGQTTSHGAGMAFPDWPTVAGYNMFLVPLEVMFHDLFNFLEHSHRLVATLAGLMTVILAGWMLAREPRLWVRVLAIAAVALVIAQGFLGGFRVLLNAQLVGALHGVLGQSYFVVMITLAIITSPFWFKQRPQLPAVWRTRMGWAAGLLCTALLLQLGLGAAMRHHHNDIAVPDFPLAYGQVWPKVGGGAIDEINQIRRDQFGLLSTSALEVHLHMTHRTLAYGLAAGILAFALIAQTLTTSCRWLVWSATGWLVLVGAQFLLGIFVVLTSKHAEVATLHVLGGALTLGLGFFIWWGLLRDGYLARHAERSGTPAADSQPPVKEALPA